MAFATTWPGGMQTTQAGKQGLGSKSNMPFRGLFSGGRRFGYIAVWLFVATQIADGILTYAGVGSHGTHVEANRLAGHLMEILGVGPAVTGTKLLTSIGGLALHGLGVHRLVASIAVYYLVVAVLPWAFLLFVR